MDLMNLYQVLTDLMVLGYERYRLEGDPNGWPERITCSLFRPGTTEPDVVVVAPYGLEALRTALRRAKEIARRKG